MNTASRAASNPEYPCARNEPQSPVSVRIGGETGIPELSDCWVITAPYRVGRGHMGTIGVVGPMRMNYARVMDTLTLVSRELTGMLSVDALEA